MSVDVGNDLQPDVYLWRGLQGLSALNIQLSHSRFDHSACNIGVPKYVLVVQPSEASSRDPTRTQWLFGYACFDDLTP